MKTKSKIAIAAAATLLAGAAFASLPASAHDRPSSSSAVSNQHGKHAHATVSATITGIPSSVTSSHQASHGAYFTAYQLSASATAVPASEPTAGGKRIGVRSERGSTEPVITGSTLTATLGFPAGAAGTSKYALYPSDGTAAILVTVTVSDSGVATVTSSRALTVAYSATVAAEHPAGPEGKADHGKRDGGKQDGHKGKGKGKGGKPEGGKGKGPRH